MEWLRVFSKLSCTNLNINGMFKKRLDAALKLNISWNQFLVKELQPKKKLLRGAIFITWRCLKSVRIRSFSSPYFSAFSQSEYGQIRTRKTPNMDTFHAVWCVQNFCQTTGVDHFVPMFPFFECLPVHWSKYCKIKKKQNNWNIWEHENEMDWFYVSSCNSLYIDISSIRYG